jgi:hypothetical protein
MHNMKRWTCVLILIAAGRINAADAVVPKFDMGKPATGMACGTITLSGTTTLACGYSANGMSVLAWPRGGGMGTPIIANGSVNAAGVFSYTIMGLTSGVMYNVTVTITAKNGMNMNAYGVTDPGIAKAK